MKYELQWDKMVDTNWQIFSYTPHIHWYNKLNLEKKTVKIWVLKLIKYFLKLNYEFQTDNILLLNWQINCKLELWMTKQ